MLQREVICQYCGKPAVLMLGSEVPCLYLKDDGRTYDEVLDRSFWVCAPCKAYVITHRRNLEFGTDGTEPLGELANHELRRKRLLLHEKLDPVWKRLLWSRTKVYEWLASRLGLPEDDCHIAGLTDEQCDRALILVEELAQFAKLNRRARKPERTTERNAHERR